MAKKEINSYRKWKLIIICENDVYQVKVDLEKIYAKTDQEDDYEYMYAIQEQIDKLLDMKKNERIAFEFNRNDNSEPGYIIRTK
tara:strand:+ start:21375 stop:21626 length:252 start_codon:yes stop_codon:yes gene_type:complete